MRGLHKAMYKRNGSSLVHSLVRVQTIFLFQGGGYLLVRSLQMNSLRFVPCRELITKLKVMIPSPGSNYFVHDFNLPICKCRCLSIDTVFIDLFTLHC